MLCQVVGDLPLGSEASGHKAGICAEPVCGNAVAVTRTSGCLASSAQAFVKERFVSCLDCDTDVLAGHVL